MRACIFLLAAVFAVFANTGAQESYLIPSGCTRGSCSYEAEWTYIPGNDSVEFHIRAMVGRGVWAGIGFSNDPFMPGSDAVVGWIGNDDQLTLTDRFLFERLPDRVPLDGENNVVPLRSSHADGVLTYSFSRKRNTGDSADLSLAEEDCLYFLFAWGGNGNSPDSITKHSDAMPSSERICVGPRNGEVAGVNLVGLPPEELLPPTDPPAPPSEAPGTFERGALLPHSLPDPDAPETPPDTPPPPAGPGTSEGEATLPHSPPGPDTPEVPPGTGITDSCEEWCLCCQGGHVNRMGNTLIIAGPGDACNGMKCSQHAHCKMGKCFCDPGYHVEGSECKPKTGKPGTCNGEMCPKYAHCKNGKCHCMDGYEERFGECKRKFSCLHVKCSEHSMCIGGMCRCMPGYMRTKHGCKKKDSCSGVHCSDHATCVHGQCQCESGYYKTMQGCKQIDPCTAVHCSDHAMCVKGKCLCEWGYYKTKFGCKSIVGSCHGKTCSEHATCLQGRCRCRPGYYQMAKKCHKKSHTGCKDKCGTFNYGAGCSCSHRCKQYSKCCKDYDEYCAHSSGVAPVSKCTGIKCPEHGFCMEGKCVCKPDYHMDGIHCKLVSTSSREMCGGKMCYENAHCSDGKCHCDEGYYESMGSCKESVSKCTGMRCSEHGFCMEGKCHCKRGYYMTGGVCKSVSSSSRPMCGGKMCYQHAHCEHGKCRCDDGYYASMGRCKKHSQSGCRRRCGKYNHEGKCSCSHVCKNHHSQVECCHDFDEHCSPYLGHFRPHG